MKPDRFRCDGRQRDWPALIRGLPWLALAGVAQAQELTEADYLSEVPIVLTASRLSQSLHDVPGSMTVIDRDQIRRWGARDVTELLRLVPGYLIGGVNGANPVAAYHVPQDEFGIRNLVLVDGRSVYSSSFLGDTHYGMMAVSPDDIERIEVMRGANSAAYGANAMFGVINIITRHTLDTQGSEVSVNTGAGGVRDFRVSHGWGGEHGSYRLSASSKSDQGYANAFDERRLQLLDWRADIRPSGDDDLMLRAGASDLLGGRGIVGNAGDPARTLQRREWFLQGRWQRQLSADAQWQLSADLSDERIADFSIVPCAFLRSGRPVTDSCMLDYRARGQRANLEFQHSDSLSADLRAVWGLGWKQEQAQALPYYNTSDRVGYDEARAFGHLEWRPTEGWTVNAGVFAGQHSRVGRYLAPRLMLNHHFTPDQTLRFGVNRSVRTNSLLELAGDMHYYTTSGELAGRGYLGGGDIRPEELLSQEVSYLGSFRPWHLTVDLRAYRERISDWVSVISNMTYLLNKGAPDIPRQLLDNLGSFAVRGLEYQLSWSPDAGIRLQWQQNFSQLEWSDPTRNTNWPPPRASTMTWLQSLPSGIDLALMWHERAAMSWGGEPQTLPSARRLDLRLAHPWRLESGSKAEVALTLQSLNGDQTESRLAGGYQFQRRAFLTLRLEH
jgi:iron complex outermembrane receptor protein